MESMILIQGYKHRGNPSAHVLIYMQDSFVVAHAFWDTTKFFLKISGRDNPHYIPILPTDTQKSLWNQRCD